MDNTTYLVDVNKRKENMELLAKRTMQNASKEDIPLLAHYFNEELKKVAKDL